ncbi:DUF2141 domain-containing protein [Muriicola sp. Z0-33]|uniref:DUF2141 domain-containing protein n=1 Tax=Muriicola sp. Z0-33 TaxID=2816957 RepID=UPI00223875A5|nr:DUF2141 domain-containing protein [Muriicola sp. Z0-33]MCW5516466.1 DUF2141 domain-containing protein [Muriicola sp. Z0-33]
MKGVFAIKRSIFLFLLFPLGLLAQNSLSVEVLGVKNSEGKISVAIYDSSDSFLKFDKVFKTDSTKAKSGSTKIFIGDLPEGNYALAIFHDENGNDVLDTNWLGIPKEAVGFSNAKMKTFGPPSFKECLIEHHGNDELTVQLQ